MTRLLARIGLFLASLVLTLVAIEIVFRVLGIRAEFHRPYVDSLLVPEGSRGENVPYGRIPNSILRSTYDSNPRGYFGPANEIDHRYNSVGWRDVDHALDKPPGTYRILGLGDSYLFGQGVRREDVCLTVLGRLLAERFPDRKIETINSGLRSMNTAQERDLLVAKGLQYDPDLVILHFVLNDVERAEELFLPRPKIEFTEEFVRIYDRPDRLTGYSRLWGWARQRYLKAVSTRDYIDECLTSFDNDSGKWQQARAAIDDIQRICRGRGIRLLVVIFPFFYELNDGYPFQPIHDTVREHCESQQIPVIDLIEHYREFNGPELWVHPTDQHPNELAHAIAARAIAAHLKTL